MSTPYVAHPAPATEAIDLIRGALLMLADDAAGRVSKAAVLAAVAKVRREVMNQ